MHDNNNNKNAMPKTIKLPNLQEQQQTAAAIEKQRAQISDAKQTLSHLINQLDELDKLTLSQHFEDTNSHAQAEITSLQVGIKEQLDRAKECILLLLKSENE
ncbi:hypothetical protein [Paraferrimonas sp. SM1919]|uniref:hypothetical protein n=1 Tax=Paraferrimonas sp. SM1919 TaxID=2662263 RepID=UPI0013D475FB|nr:hypothetical protein [Paraferrimonas sp. SM1919]